MASNVNVNNIKKISILFSGGFSKQFINTIFVESEYEDDLIEHALLVNLTNRLKGETPHRIKNYIPNVIRNCNGKQFHSHFRMTRETFENLLRYVGPALQRHGNTGRRTIDPEKQLLVAIWIFATPDSYSSIGERFDLAKSTLSVIFFRVINEVNRLSLQIIKWPSAERINYIKRKFCRTSGIDNILAAIDGSYIAIKAPKHNPEVYINRKCFHAFTLQAVCDPWLKFLDCYIAYPSSVSDIRIFKNSDIYHNIVQNKQQYFPNEEFLIGNKAYPVLTWLLVPYIDRGNLTGIQRNFNLKLSQGRQAIERAFALLKGRFRRLKYLDMNRTDFIPYVILAACVLHNVCIEFNDDMVDEYIQEGRQYINGDDVQVCPGDYIEEGNAGKAKRNVIAHDLM